MLVDLNFKMNPPKHPRLAQRAPHPLSSGPYNTGSYLSSTSDVETPDQTTPDTTRPDHTGPDGRVWLASARRPPRKLKSPVLPFALGLDDYQNIKIAALMSMSYALCARESSPFVISQEAPPPVSKNQKVPLNQGLVPAHGHEQPRTVEEKKFGRIAPRTGYCSVTPGGGGGVVWASARAQPATHPPTHPTLPGGGGGRVYALHPQSHTSIQAICGTTEQN